MNTQLLLQVVISGVSVGCIYALVAVGFGIVFNSTGAVNFAQGEYLMLAGVSAGFAHELLGTNFWISAAIALVICLVAGFATELIGVRPLRQVNPDTVTIMTIGFAVALKSIVMLVTSKQSFGLPSPLGQDSIHVVGAVLAPQAIVNVGVLICTALILVWFFRTTRKGTVLRAAADDREILRTFGVSYHSTARWAFMIAAGVGGIAGLALISMTSMSFDSGTLLGLKGFAAAMLGGLGNMYGALAAGLILGLAEAFVAGYWDAAYADTVAFVILLLVLVTRPTGIFRKAGVARV